ncbi:hypothetical protein MRX96_046688 [Rhipicephalus microplus]
MKGSACCGEQLTGTEDIPFSTASTGSEVAVVGAVFFVEGGPMKDVLERVAAGDDVSDFSDLSESDEEEWTAPSPGAPDHSSEDEEADDFVAVPLSHLLLLVEETGRKPCSR